MIYETQTTERTYSPVLHLRTLHSRQYLMTDTGAAILLFISLTGVILLVVVFSNAIDNAADFNGALREHQKKGRCGRESSQTEDLC